MLYITFTQWGIFISLLKEPNVFVDVDHVMIIPPVKACKWMVLKFPWPTYTQLFHIIFKPSPTFIRLALWPEDWWVTFAQEIRSWSGDCVVRTERLPLQISPGLSPSLTVAHRFPENRVRRPEGAGSPAAVQNASFAQIGSKRKEKKSASLSLSYTSV